MSVVCEYDEEPLTRNRMLLASYKTIIRWRSESALWLRQEMKKSCSLLGGFYKTSLSAFLIVTPEGREEGGV